MPRPTPAGPCVGIRVVDFTTMVAGSFSAQILGDLGADVIKIEPLAGEMMRHLQPIYKGMSAEFIHNNRNKRSLALNLKSPEGLEVARRLTDEADVVVENFRPGVMTRLGLGADELMARNRGLIYVAINGFGDTGPYVQKPAYDSLLQGLVGAMVMQGQGGLPQPIYNAIADKITAVTASQAALAALLHRERNGGLGQRVSVSMLDAFAAFYLNDQMYRYTFLDAEDEVHMPEGKNYFPIQTRDGYVVGLIASDQQFRAGCETFHAEALLEDPRFETMKARIENLGAMWTALGTYSIKIDTATALSRAEERSFALAPVQSVSEFFYDPQVRHNRTVVEVEDEELGRIRQLTPPARFEGTPAQNLVRAPRLGEHAQEILAGIGYDDEAIAKLRSAGAIS